jgi:hypothetical protein
MASLVHLPPPYSSLIHVATCSRLFLAVDTWVLCSDVGMVSYVAHFSPSASEEEADQEPELEVAPILLWSGIDECACRVCVVCACVRVCCMCVSCVCIRACVCVLCVCVC